MVFLSILMHYTTFIICSFIGILVTVIMLRIPPPLANSGRISVSLRPSTLEIEYDKLGSTTNNNYSEILKLIFLVVFHLN
jgi:hypothetical protein